MDILIRRVRPDEAAVLTEIAFSAKRHWNYPEEWIQKWTRQLTFQPSQIGEADVFAAVVGTELAGFYRLLIHGSRGILEDLWVRPEVIGQGFGRALFEHALAQCRLAGADHLEVEADPHAQGFYEKMGMHKIGDHPSDLVERRTLPVLEMKL